MKYASVRVVDSGGRPRSGEKVSVYVYQFAAGGMIGPEYTNSDGLADFTLDIDEYAEIAIYVAGSERVRRDRVRASYTVIV